MTLQSGKNHKATLHYSIDSTIRSLFLEKIVFVSTKLGTSHYFCAVVEKIEMFLTRVLSSARWVPGRQWSGKHRKKIKVTKTRKETICKREQHAEKVGSELTCEMISPACVGRQAFVRFVCTVDDYITVHALPDHTRGEGTCQS